MGIGSRGTARTMARLLNSTTAIYSQILPVPALNNYRAGQVITKAECMREEEVNPRLRPDYGVAIVG